jgi:hypothetical protein
MARMKRWRVPTHAHTISTLHAPKCFRAHAHARAIARSHQLIRRESWSESKAQVVIPERGQLRVVRVYARARGACVCVFV